MFVEKWMTPDPVTLSPDMTISAAAVEMGRHKFRHIPVAEAAPKGKKLLGIVTKYDIARAFPNNLNPFSIDVADNTVPQPLSTIMTRNVTTVTPDCAIEQAAKILRTRKFNALPVLRQDHIVGIITESDIFNALIEMTGAGAGGTKVVIEADASLNPILLAVQLSHRYQVRIQSLLSFHDHQLKGKELLTLHFAARPPGDFVRELRKLGFRFLNIA